MNLIEMILFQVLEPGLVGKLNRWVFALSSKCVSGSFDRGALFGYRTTSRDDAAVFYHRNNLVYPLAG